jgi:hypothetical protein
MDIDDHVGCLELEEFICVFMFIGFSKCQSYLNIGTIFSILSKHSCHDKGTLHQPCDCRIGKQVQTSVGQLSTFLNNSPFWF